jgi:hypothetical protein
MKGVFIVTLVVFISLLCKAQDVIYKKDQTKIFCKIEEIGTEKIWYYNLEIKKGPKFEILISDVSKIKFKNGIIQNYSPSEENVLIDSISKTISTETKVEIDTNNYATLYFLFNDGIDETYVFPIFINNKFIYSLKNKMRLQYKVYSIEPVLIERINKGKYGPKVALAIEKGKSYGIRILVNNVKTNDPNQKYTIEKITNDYALKKFLDEEFYGFKPFKSSDIILSEDISNKIVH